MSRDLSFVIVDRSVTASGMPQRAIERLLAVGSRYFPSPLQPVGIVDRVPNLVSKDPHAPGPGAAFDFEHLAQLEPRESWVRQVEWNRHSRDAVWRKPVVRKPEVRAKIQAPRIELLVDFGDSSFERRPFDGDSQIAEPDIE